MPLRHPSGGQPAVNRVLPFSLLLPTLVLASCHSVQSNLAGTWCCAPAVDDPSLCKGGPVLRFDAKGHFDWTGTGYAVITRINNIHRPREATAVLWQPGFMIEVLWAEYTPDTSALMLFEKHPLASGAPHWFLATHHAHLVDTNTIEYRVVTLLGTGRVVDAVFELVRCPACPHASEPFPDVAEWLGHGYGAKAARDPIDSEL